MILHLCVLARQPLPKVRNSEYHVQPRTIAGPTGPAAITGISTCIPNQIAALAAHAAHTVCSSQLPARISRFKGPLAHERPPCPRPPTSQYLQLALANSLMIGFGIAAHLLPFGRAAGFASWAMSSVILAWELREFNHICLGLLAARKDSSTSAAIQGARVILVRPKQKKKQRGPVWDRCHRFGQRGVTFPRPDSTCPRARCCGSSSESWTSSTSWISRRRKPTPSSARCVTGWCVLMSRSCLAARLSAPARCCGRPER